MVFSSWDSTFATTGHTSHMLASGCKPPPNSGCLGLRNSFPWTFKLTSPELILAALLLISNCVFQLGPTSRTTCANIAASYILPATCCLLSVACCFCLLHPACFLLLAACCLLTPAACHLLPAASYLLAVVCCLLLAPWHENQNAQKYSKLSFVASSLRFTIISPTAR